MSDRGFAPWTGRDDGPAVEHARWHTVTTAWGADAVGGSAHPWGQDPGVRTAVLVGFASDEGVRRNGGRVGAAEGPGALRAALANLSDPGCPVFDAGDVVVDDGDLEGGQIRLGEVVREILDVGAVPVVLGGGHAVAYGTYLGWAGRPGWGVLNLDAHFDLRVADRATSGTPFAQMAAAETAAGRHFAYSVAGIARASNTRALFDAADRLGVRVLLDEDCTPDRAIAFAEDAIAGLDRVHLSVDLDVLPAGTAPGVSAPAGLGVALEAVWRTVRAVAASGKLGLLEVAELNPRFDVDGRTARTAARLIDAAVRG